jgi:hypothetical protein
MRNLFTAVVLLVCMAAQAFAATEMPQTISFQARLTQVAGGVPVDGVTSVVFSIYTSLTGGPVIWTETQTIDVDQGNLVALLGSVTPFTLACDETYFLGVKVGTDAEMTPRFEMASSAYAMRAQVAESALVLGTATTETTLTAALATKADIAALNDDDNTTVPVGWTDLFGVPATFTPSAHAHSSLDASDGNPANVLAIDADGFASLNESTGGNKGTANLYVQRPDNDYGENKSCINTYRYGNDGTAVGGTAWGASYVDTAIKGLSDYGNEYSAAIAGYGVLDWDNSAAIIGADWNGNTRAMLAYNFGGTTYAGYFVGPTHVEGNSTVSGTLGVNGLLSANASVLVAGNLDVGNDATVDGSLTVGGNVDVTGTVTATAITMPTGAAAGSVLTSDAVGNAAWAATATPSAHVHSGADITSGTVGTGYYSAIGDLNAEAAIGVGAAQVAAGNHQHGSVGSTGYSNSVLALGDNYIYPVNLTPTQNMRVLVTSACQIYCTATTTVTNTDIFFRTCYKVGLAGVNTTDGTFGLYVPVTAVSQASGLVEASYTVDVSPGSTYYFGGAMLDVGATSVGASAAVRTTILAIDR